MSYININGNGNIHIGSNSNINVSSTQVPNVGIIAGYNGVSLGAVNVAIGTSSVATSGSSTAYGYQTIAVGGGGAGGIGGTFGGSSYGYYDGYYSNYNNMQYMVDEFVRSEFESASKEKSEHEFKIFLAKKINDAGSDDTRNVYVRIIDTHYSQYSQFIEKILCLR